MVIENLQRKFTSLEFAPKLATSDKQLIQPPGWIADFFKPERVDLVGIALS